MKIIRNEIPFANAAIPALSLMRSTASHADISVLDFFNSLTTTSAGLLTMVAAMPPRVPPTLVDIISGSKQEV